MPRAMTLHTNPIAAHTVHIQCRQIKLFQHHHVLCLGSCVANHCLHSFRRAAIITLTITAIGTSHGVAVNIDWFILTDRSRYGYGNNPATIRLNNLHMLVRKYIYIDLLRIIDGIPKLRHHLFCMRKINGTQGMIRQLFHAEQDDAAYSVGKSRIGFPDAARQTASSFFSFNAIVLAIYLNIAEVEHMKTSLALTASIIAQVGKKNPSVVCCLPALYIDKEDGK